MVEVIFDIVFKKDFKKIKNRDTKEKIIKIISKIRENPEIGKPMMYSRKGEREVYLDSFKLYYKLYPDENRLRFVEFSHKDNQ